MGVTATAGVEVGLRVEVLLVVVVVVRDLFWEGRGAGEEG